MQEKFYQCVQNENKNATPFETIRAIKDAGFDGVFVQWYDKDWEISQAEQVKYCKELGLDIFFAHLGYSEINNIWVEGSVGEELVGRYIKDLNDCKANGIDLVCMHLSSKSVAPDPSEIGIKRLQKIVDHADWE